MKYTSSCVIIISGKCNTNLSKHVCVIVISGQCSTQPQRLCQRLVGWLVGWLFNGTSTQKGQFVPSAREGNWLRRLRRHNETQCILPYVTR